MCKDKKNQRLKALISTKAKKSVNEYALKSTKAKKCTVGNHLLQIFTLRAHNNLQGVFLAMIGFATLGHCLFIGDDVKK